MTELIKKIIEKLKKLYSLFALLIKSAAICAAIVAFIASVIVIFDHCEKRDIKRSYKSSILQETNTARNKLDYILLQEQVEVRANISLEHRAYVSQYFADNLNTKKDLTDLYQALSSAQTSAEDLIRLRATQNPDRTTMQNRKNDIKRAVVKADKIGTQVAKEIDGVWDVPSSKTQENERIKYYETKPEILDSIATAPAKVPSK